MARSPIHPGEVLAEQLEELDLSVRQFARAIDVPANRVSEILRGRRAITADTALRLGHYFDTDPRFWLNLQQSYELRLAERVSAKRIARLPKLKRAPLVAAAE